MTEVAKFELVAATLRAKARHSGALVRRAKMVMLAEHFERLARTAADERDWAESGKPIAVGNATEHH